MQHHKRSKWNWQGNTIYRKSKPVIITLGDDIKVNKDGADTANLETKFNSSDSAYKSLVKKIKMVDEK